jgi:hypothetical protein
MTTDTCRIIVRRSFENMRFWNLGTSSRPGLRGVCDPVVETDRFFPLKLKHVNEG